MGRILKFFGYLVMGIALTLVFFGHVTMVMIYGFDYMLNTLMPKDPDTLSSIWLAIASLFPGGMLWGIGWGLERFDATQQAKNALASEAKDQVKPEVNAVDSANENADKDLADAQTDSLK